MTLESESACFTFREWREEAMRRPNVFSQRLLKPSRACFAVKQHKNVEENRAKTEIIMALITEDIPTEVGYMQMLKFASGI
jgi:hypothetical protein